MVEIKAADLEVRCFFTWRMKGHNRFYGSVWKTPMGLEGSGAFRRPGSIVRVLRTERWVRPTERAGSEGSFICRCLGQRKPLQPPCGRGNAIPLWWLTPPPCPVGSMSLDSRVARLPYESSSFATSRRNESVTGLAFCITWHDKHSVIGSLRSPPPFPLRGTSPASGSRIKHRKIIFS